MPQRVSVRFAVQAEPRGTADAVYSAHDTLYDAPFLVLNSDNYYPVAAYRDLAEVGASGLVAFEADTLVRESRLEPERVLRYALLDVDDDGLAARGAREAGGRRSARAARRALGVDEPVVVHPDHPRGVRARALPPRAASWRSRTPSRSRCATSASGSASCACGPACSISRAAPTSRSSPRSSRESSRVHERARAPLRRARARRAGREARRLRGWPLAHLRRGSRHHGPRPPARHAAHPHQRSHSTLARPGWRYRSRRTAGGRAAARAGARTSSPSPAASRATFRTPAAASSWSSPARSRPSAGLSSSSAFVVAVASALVRRELDGGRSRLVRDRRRSPGARRIHRRDGDRRGVRRPSRRRGRRRSRWRTGSRRDPLRARGERRPVLVPARAARATRAVAHGVRHRHRRERRDGDEDRQRAGALQPRVGLDARARARVELRHGTR